MPSFPVLFAWLCEHPGFVDDATLWMVTDHGNRPVQGMLSVPHLLEAHKRLQPASLSSALGPSIPSIRDGPPGQAWSPARAWIRRAVMLSSPPL
jgi:hypothetical protein